MTDLRGAVLDARYIDLIDLASALVAEFGEDIPADAPALASPQEQAMAAAIFRWAAGDYAVGAVPDPETLADDATEDA